MGTRTVAVLAFDDVQLLDVTGPAEAFATADTIAGGDAYAVRVVSPTGADVIGSSGVRMGVHSALSELTEPLDTLVVPGTHAFRTRMGDPDLLAALGEGMGRARRVAAVCGGAFLVGALGGLDGRRATTHWQFLDELQDTFPTAAAQRP